MTKNVALYLISDAVGETTQKLVSVVTAQFPTIEFSPTYRFPFINDKEELTEILKDALSDKAIVLTTLVNPELVETVTSFCQRTGLQSFDLMTPFTEMIHAQTGVAPLNEPGVVHQLNKEYFSRIAAIEFAVKYDDGKDPRGFLEADLVLLGVSRTSKTPLSMYLANKHLKVANLPLIPEVPLPEQLKEVPANKIIGLTCNPDNLEKIRTNRLQSLGLDQLSKYTNSDRIREELQYAQDIFDTLGVTVIDVTHKSIEESAFLVLEALDKKEHLA